MMWSRWIIAWVSVLVAFQVVLTTAVGAGALEFPKNETFLNVVPGTNFLQVVVLAPSSLSFFIPVGWRRMTIHRQSDSQMRRGCNKFIKAGFYRLMI
ncbi:hypothetical protein [Sphingomonas sp. PB4P5]|uniref:hypothetical protein n=1 Tax=Parasphingomonas puruogangriensis TaxID=3096155 RepID=UPI002FC588FB